MKHKQIPMTDFFTVETTTDDFRYVAQHANWIVEKASDVFSAIQYGNPQVRDMRVESDPFKRFELYAQKITELAQINPTDVQREDSSIINRGFESINRFTDDLEFILETIQERSGSAPTVWPLLRPAVYQGITLPLVDVLAHRHYDSCVAALKKCS